MIITKIKMYFGIGLLALIIILLITIGIQQLHIRRVENDNNNLKIENQKVVKENEFKEAQVIIQSNFYSSTQAIKNITNEIVFSSNKQFSIDKVLEAYNNYE